MIKKAEIKDVQKIYELLQLYWEQGILLPRPLSTLYENVRNFLVYKDENDDLLGCCALSFCWEYLAEIRSLAVHPDHTKKGIGSMLLKAQLKEAVDFKIKKLFTLTYVPDFFQRFGFKKIEKKNLPLKIWSDCIHCSKFPNCDEIAMMLHL
jgi:amino-acid N-acetyltransferase